MPVKGKTEKPEPAKERLVQAPQQGAKRRTPEKVLFKWIAPSRPFKRQDREFWITVVAIAAIVGLIIFAIESSVMPVILIISLVFLFYILTTVEPEKIEYSVTNYGVKIVDKRTDWDLVRRYWFSKRFDNELLVFETFVLPGRLELVINLSEKEKIKKVLKDYVVEEETPPSYLDKTTNWFAKRMPGN